MHPQSSKVTLPSFALFPLHVLFIVSRIWYDHPFNTSAYGNGRRVNSVISNNSETFRATFLIAFRSDLENSGLSLTSTDAKNLSMSTCKTIRLSRLFISGLEADVPVRWDKHVIKDY